MMCAACTCSCVVVVVVVVVVVANERRQLEVSRQARARRGLGVVLACVGTCACRGWSIVVAVSLRMHEHWCDVAIVGDREGS